MSTDVLDQRKSKTREKRRKLLSSQYLAWFIHSFIGLKLSLVMTLVLLSGALAVLAEEVDWLIYPEMRVERQPGQEHMNPGQIEAAIEPYFPNLGVYYVEVYPDRPYLAAQVDFDRPDGSYGKIWVNPYTGEIQGELDYLTPGRFLSRFHGSLFLDTPGRILVNFFGVLILISLVTGLIAYPKFWRFFLKKPRRGNTRVFLADLHKLVGLWSLWIVLLMAVSGTWWFYQYPLVWYLNAPNPIVPRMPEPVLSREKMEELTGEPRFLPSEQIIAAAEKIYPELKVTIIQPPEHNAGNYTLRGLMGEWLVPAWSSNYLYMNPYTAEVSAIDKVADATLGQRFDMAMQSLHYGNWGYSAAHIPIKILWCVGGLAMTFLSVSGLLISYKRARKSARKLKKHHWAFNHFSESVTEKQHKIWQIVRPWGGPMSVLKYANILVIVGVVVGFIQFFNTQTSGDNTGYFYADKALGPWMVSARASVDGPGQAPVRPGMRTSLMVNIPFDALDKVKFFHARVGKPRTLRAPGTLISGAQGAKGVSLRIPKRANEKSELWITAETWSGEFYQVSWPLFPVDK